MNARTRAAAVVGLLVALLVALTPATATSEPVGRLLIFGDSTSSWYSNQPGSPSRGWWSIVAERTGMEPVLSAEAGSGMWARGNKCGGTKFGDRLAEIDRVRPAAIIVAGGRNDYHGCLGGQGSAYGNLQLASIERAIDAYMARLAERVDAIGLPREQVYVFTPWGDTLRSSHYYVWRFQKAAAERYGFTYRVVRFLDGRNTLDGTHPNAAGNRILADSFLAAGGIR